MRFKVTLRPSDVELLPEPMRSEVRKQVPEQVDRERHRIDLAMARLAEWDAENRRWQDYAKAVVNEEIRDLGMPDRSNGGKRPAHVRNL